MIKKFFITAYRNLVRNKLFTFLNVLGLTIGVVVCLVIGVWLQRELSFDNFHPNGKQIYRVSNTFKSESESFSQAPSGPALGSQLPKHLPSLKSGCRLFSSANKFKVGSDYFVESKGMVADSNFFDFFGFELVNGDPKKALQMAEQIVLTEKLAIKYFGRENPIGKILTNDDRESVVVSGVAANPPANSHIQFDYIIPFSQLRKRAQQQWNANLDEMWSGGWPDTYLQLADGTDPGIAEKQINEVVAKFAEKEWKENKMSYRYFLQPIRDIHLKSHLRYDAENNGSLARVNIFSIVGIIVLLLACINYTNLTTAGALKRAKETSVRKVVGATKGQLIRQFFTETILICIVAVTLGVVILKLILPAFSAWTGQPYTFDLTGANLVIILCFIFFISSIAGIYPAAVLSSFNPAVSLKGNLIQSAKGNIIRKTLVVFQFTITIALVASILIISRQMNYIKNKSLGFDGNAVIEVNFQGDATVTRQYASLRNELLSSPYILNVSKHGANVVGGLGNGWTTTENLKGEEISTSLYMMSVDTTYFQTYDMKLAAGRFFSKDIPTDTSKAVLVNEAAVRTFGWQKPENAIGKRFGKGDDTRYVIGVVKDFNFESLHKPVEALQIVYWKGGNNLSLKIDARHTDEAINHLQKLWRAFVPDVPLQYAFIDEKLTEQYGNENKMQGIFYAFAGLSLLIACIGLFGLSIYVVERKVKEIGIRKVLGASIPGLVNLLSKDFLKLVLIAIVIATPLSWVFMNNWLKDFAYRINISWTVFIVAGSVAVLIALITVSFKAIRAAIANPVKSLRTE